MKRVYLDVCCLNRPFDDQSKARIHLESEAVLLILKRFESSEWMWISSAVVNYEIDQTPDTERRRRARSLLKWVHQIIPLTEEIVERGEEIKKLGFKSYDALHIASAEAAKSDVLLTTDDKLIYLALKYPQVIKVSISNPLLWLQKETDNG